MPPETLRDHLRVAHGGLELAIKALAQGQHLAEENDQILTGTKLAGWYYAAVEVKQELDELLYEFVNQ